MPRTASPKEDITGVILAGGKARRMAGADKGLMTLRGRPVIEYIIESLRPQVGKLVINANHNRERYAAYGLPVVADMPGDHLGPLAGMATGMQITDSSYILTVPCDAPFIPDTLVDTLYHTLLDNQADISVAHDGERMQQVFALLRCKLLPDLLAWLDAGGRKVETWFSRQHTALADLSGEPNCFINLNTPADRSALERRIAS